MFRTFVLSKLYKYEHSTFYIIENFVKISGAWYPDSPMINSILFYIIFAFSSVLDLSVFINLILNFSYNLFMSFIMISSFYLILQKVGTIFINRKQWKKALVMMTEIETEAASKKSSKQDKLIEEHKKYTILYLFTYLLLINISVFIILLVFWITCVLLPICGPVENLTPMINLIDAWLPFDEYSRYGRILSGIVQTIYALIGTLFCMIFDCMFISIMIFLKGQLKVLKVRCNIAFEAEMSEELCAQNLIKCHNHYVNILRCVEHINTLISPVMFLQFCQISTVLGVCIMKIVFDTNTMLEILWLLEVLFGTFFQLWLQYNLANNVTIEAEGLPYAVFESNWVGRSPRLQRDIAMLAAGMSTRISFKAGPWTDISLRALTQILKTSYSFYALLSHTSKK